MPPFETNELSKLEMFVIEVLQDDIESVSTIVKLVNDPEIGLREAAAGKFSELEVGRALKRLLGKNLVELLIYDPHRKELVRSDHTDTIEFVPTETWFALTDTGRGSRAN